MKKLGWVIAVSTLLSGCTFPPSINVLGAYFPDWMFCIISGVSLTAIVSVIHGRYNLERWLRPTALTYPVLTTFFSIATWLIFFQN